MLIDVITIFPEMFPPVLGASILGRAQASGRLRIQTHYLRDYTHDRHRSVDDRPYGGGPGMVMRVEPIFEAVEAIKRKCGHTGVRHPACGGEPDTVCQMILMSPQGERLSSPAAQQLSAAKHLILICGRYEGVDERVRAGLVDRSISIGDYVLTGGELPAMVLIDCVARFLPEVIGHEQATEEESFAAGLLEYPQYTRPPVFRDMAVPEVLLSGDHGQVAEWRKQQAVARTMAVRPDLLKSRTTETQNDHRDTENRSKGVT
ncbi:MAG: tRNA (guanosine(37)-N1)-methyltransferase TrmD [Candidatus Omnitrophica bacterium]|nr:tRNA (guanosine(37)-N1)-methyltransferase TrmD [Candidatus Omnitrophota bacterium]